MTSSLEEKEEIRDLLYRYCYSLDNQRFDEIGEMFTEDGVMHSLLVVKAEGRQAVVDFLTRAVPKKGEGPARKHCTVNTLIRLDGDRATASSYMLFFREADTGIMTASAGRYEDILVKEGGAWRFKLREIHLDLVDDPGLKIAVDLPHSTRNRGR
jgi:3-phenylpropionate/cinnamic acid dioxygenase small subunit